MSGAASVDAAIAGGGIIGLSLGLELLRRGLKVAVLERGCSMHGASWAAAGMLAVDDPQNPPALMPMARRSQDLYPEYLAQIEGLSGLKVPLRTRYALQYIERANGNKAAVSTAELAEIAPALVAGDLEFIGLEEASLDPRDLCAALPAAFKRAGGQLLEGTEALMVTGQSDGVMVQTSGATVAAGIFVNCCGAWAAEVWGKIPVFPVKGQMLNLRHAPEGLQCVVRAPGVYLVPRGDGRLLAGATIERVGFDEELRKSALDGLTWEAMKLVSDARVPEPREAWAGFRPGTPDGLPILGEAAEANCWHATGHYRDGILLAPATARVMAQRILGEPAEIALEPFSPLRFFENDCA